MEGKGEREGRKEGRWEEGEEEGRRKRGRRKIGRKEERRWDGKENGVGDARDWVHRVMGSYCLMGTEFQIEKMKSSGDGWG